MAVFGDLNKAEVIGNMTQDAELKFTPNGTAVTNFSIATNRSYKAGEEWKEEVAYHNIVVWGNDAQSISQRAKKGTRLYIQGRLQTRSWEDSDGKKNYRTEIVSEKIILLDRYEKGEMDSKSGGTSYSNNSSESSSKSSPKKSKPKSETQAPPDDEDIIDPDDLPF
jgi:single-strand DNA-binding protein